MDTQGDADSRSSGAVKDWGGEATTNAEGDLGGCWEEEVGVWLKHAFEGLVRG